MPSPPPSSASAPPRVTAGVLTLVVGVALMALLAVPPVIPTLDGARQGLIGLIGAVTVARFIGLSVERWRLASAAAAVPGRLGEALARGVLGLGFLALGFGCMMLVTPDRALGFCVFRGSEATIPSGYPELDPSRRTFYFERVCQLGAAQDRESFYRQVYGGIFLGPAVPFRG